MAKRYGKWEVVRSLSEGSQGATFIVRSLDDDKNEEYVLKRLKNAERIGRFRQEIEAGIRVEHKNILSVIDYDFKGPSPYIVTAYCKGGSFAEARPFEYSDNGRLIDLFGQICDGVAAAHDEGIIHRDLKPENIFLWGDKQGDAVVGDFGLCFLQNEPRQTDISEAVGPRNYMAPELEDGRIEHVSEKCDIYSLGKILYWLLSHGRIFSREKHREPLFDLVRVTGNRYLEHANKLLDKMIVLKPEDRMSLYGVRSNLDKLKWLIVNRYNPVGVSVDALCYYCGIGHYVIGARTPEEIGEFFFRTGLPGEWRILVCNHCGHVQIFRPDLVQSSAWE